MMIQVSSVEVKMTVYDAAGDGVVAEESEKCNAEHDWDECP